MVAEEVILLLGGNRGDRRMILQEALAQLGEQAGEIVAVSSLYDTEPWGFEDPVPFLNCAVMLRTSLSPEELLRVTQGIERAMGRERHGEGYEGRTLDIDLLFFGERVIDTPDLQVPHPRLAERRFVLVPVAEIAAGTVHPVTGLTVGEMLERCADKKWVRKAGVLNL